MAKGINPDQIFSKIKSNEGDPWFRINALISIIQNIVSNAHGNIAGAISNTQK